MKKSTALYVIGADTPDSTVSEAAEAAARVDGHLRCAVLAQAPVLPMSAYGAVPYGGIAVPDAWPEQLTEARTALVDRANEIEKLLARSAASGDVRPVLAAPPDIADAVALSAMTTDVAYIAPDLRAHTDLFRYALHGILFQSPVGAVLNSAPMTAASSIFIAWDDSLAAARAVHAALPQIQAAKDVVIGCIDPSTVHFEDEAEPGSDCAAWLSHHGVNVTVSQYPSGGQEISACIGARASEVGADLVVMGAYSHSRMRQAIFGGTTKEMVDQTEVPVFMAH